MFLRLQTYNHGTVMALELSEPTLPELMELQTEYGFLDDATITAECDCYQGCEGPSRHVEISWSVTPEEEPCVKS